MSGKKGKKSAGTSKEKEKEEQEFEAGSWECTVCTFRNRCEAFKCEMCDTRKGTSTRKPRLNPTVVEHQTLVQRVAVQQNLIDRMQRKPRNSDSKSLNSPESSISGISTSKLNPADTSQPSSSSSQPTKNTNASKISKRKPVPFSDDLVIRSSAKKHDVTFNGVTFTITEFKPRVDSSNAQKIKKIG